MFGVGLHFHFKELLAVRRVAIPGAVGQSLVATLLGCLVGLGFGWGWSAGLVFGLAISVASTVVLLRVSSTTTTCTRRPATSPSAGSSSRICSLSWCWSCCRSFSRPIHRALQRDPGSGLVCREDRPAGGVCCLRRRASLALAARPGGGDALARAFHADRFGAGAGHRRRRGQVVRRVDGPGRVSGRYGRRPVGLQFAGRVGSVAHARRLRRPVLRLRRHAVQPGVPVEAPWLVAATLGIVLLGKPLAALAIVLLLRYPLRVGLAVAVALAQIGEFSFILAAPRARELGIIVRGGDQRARRRRDCFDQPESDPLSANRHSGSTAKRSPRAVASG